jgi:hypothetical protein
MHQAADARIALIVTAEGESEVADEPEPLESPSKKSSSLASAAAEGFKALGSFFAQAAVGGAEVRGQGE